MTYHTCVLCGYPVMGSNWLDMGTGNIVHEVCPVDVAELLKDEEDYR